MALIRAEAQQVEAANAFLATARRELQQAAAQRARHDGSERSALEINGPVPAPMPRRAGYLRAQLILSAPERRVLHAALDAALPAIYAAPEARKVRWSLDVDPADLY